MGSPDFWCLGQGAALLMLPLGLGVHRAEELDTGRGRHGPAVDSRMRSASCHTALCLLNSTP